MLKQAKMSSHRNGPMYKFGVQVPRNKRDAKKLDTDNGNRKWHDAEQAELAQLHEYDVFQDKGILNRKLDGLQANKSSFRL